MLLTYLVFLHFADALWISVIVWDIFGHFYRAVIFSIIIVILGYLVLIYLPVYFADIILNLKCCHHTLLKLCLMDLYYLPDVFGLRVVQEMHAFVYVHQLAMNNADRHRQRQHDHTDNAYVSERKQVVVQKLFSYLLLLT